MKRLIWNILTQQFGLMLDREKFLNFITFSNK